MLTLAVFSLSLLMINYVRELKVIKPSEREVIRTICLVYYFLSISLILIFFLKLLMFR